MLYAVIGLLLIVIDQITKFLVVKNIPLYTDISVIKNILSLTYVKNTGAAWGSFSDNTVFLTVLVVIILVLISFYVYKNRTNDIFFNSGITLVYAGAIGNLIDRFTRDGAVVDMIKTDFIDFPVFNFADCCVVIGAVLFAIYIIFRCDDNKEKKNG